MSLPPDISEADFQAEVVDAARRAGFLTYHTHNSRRSAPGFPDLVLARPGDRIIFAELKTDRGRVRPDQRRWLDALASAGAETYVWVPSVWDVVLEVLARRSVGR